jgi:hypothetical protein
MPRHKKKHSKKAKFVPFDASRSPIPRPPKVTKMEDSVNLNPVDMEMEVDDVPQPGLIPNHIAENRSGRANFAFLNPSSASTIEKLPHKVLKQILSYVPSRRQACQVNKKFYRAACELDNEADIYRLKIDEEIDKMVRDLILKSDLS